MALNTSELPDEGIQSSVSLDKHAGPNFEVSFKILMCNLTVIK